MKIKDEFIIYESEENERLLVSTNTAKDSFRGLARSNETAAFIIDCLKEDISKDDLVKKIAAEYNAPEEQIASDLDELLEKFRQIGALDE